MSNILAVMIALTVLKTTGHDVGEIEKTTLFVIALIADAYHWVRSDS